MAKNDPDTREYQVKMIATLIDALDIETEVMAELNKPVKKSIADEEWHVGEYGYIYNAEGCMVNLYEFAVEAALLPDLVRVVVKHLYTDPTVHHVPVRDILNRMDVPIGDECEKNA